MRTTIDLGARDLALDERSAGLTATRHLDARRSVGVAAGVILDGTATPEGELAQDIGYGGLLAVSGTWLAVLERPRRPFVQLAGSLSVSTTTESLTSIDGRVGAIVGKSFGPVVPYAAVRAFGGPVFWDGDAGGDRYHVSIGAGLTVRLPAHLGVFVEVMPLGEQAASAGVTAQL